MRFMAELFMVAGASLQGEEAPHSISGLQKARSLILNFLTNVVSQNFRLLSGKFRRLPKQTLPFDSSCLISPIPGPLARETPQVFDAAIRQPTVPLKVTPCRNDSPK
jgi:hypothetical protein